MMCVTLQVTVLTARACPFTEAAVGHTQLSQKLCWLSGHGDHLTQLIIALFSVFMLKQDKPCHR